MPRPLRLEEQNLADQAQRVRAAFLRRDEELDLVGEEKQPDLVVIPDRAEGEQRRDFRRQFAFRLRIAAEISRRAHIHDEHHGELALLREFLHEGVAHARGHIPIDRADFIAGLILAHFVEVHPAPLEDAVVIARENGLHETLGLDLERADFLEDFGGIHHGTGSPAKMRSMIVSLVIFSASAS